MKRIAVVSGLGHDADDEACGLGTISRRLAAVPATAVRRFTWHDVKEIAQFASAGKDVILIGHSFGGDAAVEAATVARNATRLLLIDPVPRSAWQRWTASFIEVPPTIAALCVLRGNGLLPLSKKISGPNARNVVMQGTGHCSVVSSARTWFLIEQFCFAETEKPL